MDKSKEKEKNEISICMGSSCFMRGNNIYVGKIQDFLVDNDLIDVITLRGNLCEGRCDTGPHLRWNGHSCSFETLMNHLKECAERQKSHQD